LRSTALLAAIEEHAIRVPAVLRLRKLSQHEACSIYEPPVSAVRAATMAQAVTARFAVAWA